MRRIPGMHVTIALALVICLQCLAGASAAAAGGRLTGSSRVEPSTHTAVGGPKIVVASPKTKSYALGQKFLVTFSCKGGSAITRCVATIGRQGTKAGKVISGKRMQPRTTGRYVLRVTATDRSGKRASKTVSFYVVRMISWSGYTWTVRLPGTGGPGPNAWSDSPANVRVSGSDLLLSIVRDSSGHWTSAEVDNQRDLGYGTYRWVVASDLSGLDSNDVLGMFTYAGLDPHINTIEIDSSRWGELSWTSGGVSVQEGMNGVPHDSTDFEYSNQPPYVNEFTWAPGSVTFLVTDATGATLLNWTATTAVPTPSAGAPIINYWRFHNVPPAATHTIAISSFTWVPLG